MFNALLRTFLKRSEKKTFWIFVRRKEKSVFNFHILKAAFILNSYFASGIKVSGHIVKCSEKKIQNEQCWTFQKLSQQKLFWILSSSLKTFWIVQNVFQNERKSALNIYLIEIPTSKKKELEFVCIDVAEFELIFVKKDYFSFSD